MNDKKRLVGGLALLSLVATALADFCVPAGETLAFGGPFMDRFEPVPILSPLTSDTWGATNVIPRDICNGIEDPDWSYWGGKIIKGDDGMYHMFPCRWSEDNPRGHRAWMFSEIVHAVSANPLGPYKVKAVLGPGHNPTVYRQQSGYYMVYAFNRTEKRAMNYYYRAKTLDGPWAINRYHEDLRQRPSTYEQAANCAFAMREDGSFLKVDKKGNMHVSQTGSSEFFAVGVDRVFPPAQDETTRYEDPALWYDGVQYHLITHDYNHWEAFYQRSKDGIHWVSEPGLGYGRAYCKYENGVQNEWYRYERVQVLQDELGRAMQINFAALDVDKDTEKGNDNHNSKNFCIPLTVGRQLEVLNTNAIRSTTREIRVQVKAEAGFNPLTDMDLKSLRFGAASEVNFGRGSTLVSTEKSGPNLILVFNGKGNGFTDENFAGKLLGKTRNGTLLFGWSRLPGVEYIEPLLSALPPVVSANDAGTKIAVEVTNFGQVANDTTARLEVYIKDEKVASSFVPVLKPFEKTILTLDCLRPCKRAEKLAMITKLIVNGQVQEVFKSTVTAGGRH